MHFIITRLRHRTSFELRDLGVFVTPLGLWLIWLRHWKPKWTNAFQDPCGIKPTGVGAGVAGQVVKLRTQSKFSL